MDSSNLATLLPKTRGFWKQNDTFPYTIPMGSMYGIFTYIWLIFMVNVGKYTIHGSYGIYHMGAVQNSRSQGLIWLNSETDQHFWQPAIYFIVSIYFMVTIYFMVSNMVPYISKHVTFFSAAPSPLSSIVKSLGFQFSRGKSLPGRHLSALRGQCVDWQHKIPWFWLVCHKGVEYDPTNSSRFMHFMSMDFFGGSTEFVQIKQLNTCSFVLEWW